MGLGMLPEVLDCLKQPRTWLTALVGTAAIDGFLRLAPKIGLATIDYFRINGTLLLRPGLPATVLGAGVMSMGAVLWVVLFRLARLKLRRGLSPIVVGLAFSGLVFLVSSLAVLPTVGLVHPLVRRGIMKNPGFFGLGLSGWRTPVSNLLGHAVFGLVLGVSETLGSAKVPYKNSCRPNAIRVESATGRLGRTYIHGSGRREAPKYVRPTFIWEKTRMLRKRK